MRKLTIEEFQQICKDRNGVCLSTEYKNNRTKLHFGCNICRHVWWARPDNVKNRGDWCPKCAGTKKLTIEEFQQIAIDKNGICLSKIYVNNKTKLHFKCNVCGHDWWIIPGNIKQGQWCPNCYNIKRGKNIKNEKHPMWKGDMVGYKALHKWIRKNKIKPECCEICGKKKKLELANISQEYKRDINDFEYICRSCHTIKDGRNKGENHPKYGRKHNPESIEKMRKYNIL